MLFWSDTDPLRRSLKVHEKYSTVVRIREKGKEVYLRLGENWFGFIRNLSKNIYKQDLMRREKAVNPIVLCKGLEIVSNVRLTMA